MAKETVIQLYHTLTPDEAPSPGDLVPGEVSIELASNPRRVWVGVPGTIHADEQVLLIGESVLPTGGAQYDVLSKASATDGDVEWRGAGVRPSENTVIGAGALPNTATWSGVAIGVDALAANTTGQGNTACGAYALHDNTTGEANVAVGVDAMGRVVSGNYNVAIGRYAGDQPVMGDTNIFIGNQSGFAMGMGNPNNCIYIGAFGGAGGDNQINEIAIGHSVVGRGSNTITLGNTDVTALYTRAGLVIGNNPTGGALGQGTVNISGQYHRNGVALDAIYGAGGTAGQLQYKDSTGALAGAGITTDGNSLALPAGATLTIGGVPVGAGLSGRVAWLGGTNPNNVTLFANDTGAALVIDRIVGVPEVLNGGATGITVWRVADGDALAAGTQITSNAFNAQAAVGTRQQLTVSNTAVPAGSRLVLQTTGTWLNSVGMIAVYLEPAP